MDNNAIDALIEKYEYKSPSYDVKIRQQRQGIVCDSARFRQGADGVWRPKTESTKDTVFLVIAGDLLCQEKMLAAYRKRDGSGYDFNPCFDYIRYGFNFIHDATSGF